MCYEFNLVIIIAHVGEARAIFNLNQFTEIKNSPFLAFRKHKVIIIVSGEGRLRAAGAVSFGKTLCEFKIIFWLNIGCVGHRDFPIGTVVQAGKIHDQELNRSWFPSTPFKKNIPVVEINTCTLPEENYPKNVFYDMEASGFIELAQLNSIPEQLAVVKIVTDNGFKPIRHLKVNEIEMSIKQKKNQIESLVADYLIRAAVITESIKPINLPWWLRTVKFTATQKNEVKNLINNYKVKSKDRKLPFLKILKNTSTREILEQIRREWTKERN